MTKPKFVSWDYRPAVFFRESAKGAYAVVRPGGSWERVDHSDVYRTGDLMAETEWRDCFEAKYGPLDLSKLPLPKTDE